MPEMTICPVSSFSRVVKVGSSLESISRVSLSFSRSERVLGSMATMMTGSGKCIFSRTTGQPSVPIVSPVCASFIPTMTAMSPGPHLVHGLGLVGVHAQEPRYALALLLVLVVDRARVLEATRVHAHEAQGAGLAVVLHLEHEAQRVARGCRRARRPPPPS